jgi:hypothetical protein
LEEISYDEEKLALNTNPEVKAQIYIDIEKKNIDKKMQ